MKQYDAIIIGFGKGGKLLAAELAERNWKVAIVERSPQMYGGTCVNVGCIPTKTLIHESEYAEKRYYDDYKNQSKLYALAVARIVAGEAFCARYLFRRKKAWYIEGDNSEFRGVRWNIKNMDQRIMIL